MGLRRLPTASALDRVFRCRLSHALPHAYDAPGDDATRGTAIHAYLDQARAVGRDAALEACPDDVREVCAAIDLSRIPAGGDRELALAWDHESDAARALVTDGHRDYSDVRPTEYAGTADFVGRDGDAAVVVDYKTGHRRLGPARESRQLRMLALAATRLMGVDEARVAYGYVGDDGRVVFSWGALDALDLAEVADEMRALAAALRSDERPEPHQGEHCTYCPAYLSCPAKVSLAMAIGDGSALAGAEEAVSAMQPAQLGEAYRRLELYDDVAKRVRDAIRQRAEAQDIDLGDGRVLGTVQWPYTMVDAMIAHQVVAELCGAEAADKAAPRSATLAAIKRAGKEVLAQVEQRGGVTTVYKPQVRVHAAKRRDR